VEGPRSRQPHSLHSLDGVEIVRRFLLHVLPKGFVRIRQFGCLANRARKEKLPLARELIAAHAAAPNRDDAAPPTADVHPHLDELDRCPRCERGQMKPVGAIPPSVEIPPDTS
jgi:hypothetical protein